MLKEHWRRRALYFIIGLAVVGTAQGDDSPPVQQPQSSPPVSAAGGDTAQTGKGGRDGTALEEVIVTANKRAQSSRDVPAAVNVISGAQLDKINATNFQDFATYVPGLTSLSAGTGENQVALRGVTTGNQSGATVGIYVDETPIGSSSSFAVGSNALDFNVFDLDRLEVLSGPQGTLYGASTLGGLLKYVTRAPDLNSYEELAEGDLSHTQNGTLSHGERVAFNAPLVRNHLAIRADGIAQDDSGFVDDPARALEHVDGAKTRAGRLSVLGQVTPSFSLRLSAMAQGIDRNGNTEVDRDPQTHAPVEGRYAQSARFGEPVTQHFLLYSAVLNWNLGWANLTAVSGWQNIHLFYALDTTNIYGALLQTGGAVPFKATTDNSTKKFTQEVRLSSPASRWVDWQVGTFYTIEHSTDQTGLLDAASPDGTLGGAPLFFGTIPTKYRELAGFGDATAHLTSRLDLTLGLRYSENFQSYEQRFQGLFSQPTNPFAISDNTAGSHEGVTTYLINPRYRLNEKSLIYGRFASGYRPGGPNFVTYNASGQPNGSPSFHSDTLWNYELGEKSAFLNGKALLDFDVFYIDWSNIQLVANNGGVNQLENGGKARIEGAELAGSYKVIRGLTIGGSATYTSAHLAEDAPALDAKDGQRLPLSARFAAAVTADYRMPVSDRFQASAGVSNRFVGNRTDGFDGSSDRPQYLLHSYDVVDLRAGLQAQNWSVGVFLKNAFNQLGEISADMTAVQYNPSAPARVAVTQPRTVGLQLTIDLDQ